MSEKEDVGRRVDEERRQFNRYRVDDLELKVDFGHRGRIQDLGRGGVRFETTSWLPPEREVRVWIEGAGAEGSVEGEVLRSTLVATEEDETGKTKPVYEVVVELPADGTSREWVERVSRESSRAPSERETA